MGEEVVFLNDGGTYVSNTKIVLSGTTYATANITSVTKKWTEPSRGCALLLVIAGVFCGLASLVLLADSVGSGLLSLLVSAGVVVVGFYWYRSLKPDYYVVLFSASGESRGLASKDQSAIDTVVSAITSAITHRG